MGKNGVRVDIRDNYIGSSAQKFAVSYENEMEEQSERIAEEKGIDNVKTLEDYLSNMNYLSGEYIVDGALLTCTKGTNKVMHLKDNNKVIVSEVKEDTEKSRIHIYENRTETINGFIPVTVGDCKGGFRDDDGNGINIISFGNCGFLLDGENLQQLLQESRSSKKPTIEEIKEALGKGMGTCYCFMDLEEKWDNMPTDMMNGNMNCLSAGVAKVLNNSSYFKYDGKEGINRMSMLFCRFGGGCIMALESGQNLFVSLSDDEILFITAIYGEASGCSEVAWQAIANVIMNRVGVYEWREYSNPIEIIKYTGFDAYTVQNVPYREAKAYFENRDYSNLQIERMIELVIPIFRGEIEDITQNAVLYYSPNAQKKFHEKNPQKYQEVPSWACSPLTEEVKIEGIENDDFKFYKYK